MILKKEEKNQRGQKVKVKKGKTQFIYIYMLHICYIYEIAIL